MAIENLRIIGDTLYERRDNGVLSPLSRVKYAASKLAEPDTGSRTGFPEVDRMLVTLGNLNEALNPIVAIQNSQKASRRMFEPNLSGWDRVAALGDMLSGVGGVVAPLTAVGRLGKPAATALMESLLGGSSLPDPRTEAEAIAKNILELRATGNVDAVTEAMMNAADPQYMYFNTPLPMDAVSRMARAEEMGFDVGRTRYHGSEADINEVRTDLGDQDRYRTGLFTSTNPDVADSYVSTSGGMIYPMVMRRNDGGAIIDAQGANWNRIPRDAPTYIPSSALAAEFPELAGDKFNTAYDVAPGLYDDLFNRGASTNALARQRRFEGDSNITFENVVDRGAALKNYLGETEEMARARSVSASMPSDVRVDFYGNQVRSPFARFDPEFRNLSNLSAGVAAGAIGASQYDPDAIETTAARVRENKFAAGGAVKYDPAAIDSIINQLREVNRG